MVTECDPVNGTAYCQEKVDALAYAYVLAHGYEGALALFEELTANGSRRDVAPDDALVVLSRRILDAIGDEAATIDRILTRMIQLLQQGDPHQAAAVLSPGPNSIDRHIGHRLRRRRSELGISLAALAEDLALTPAALTLIEDGAERLDSPTLERAVARLGVPATYLFQTFHSDEGSLGVPPSVRG